MRKTCSDIDDLRWQLQDLMMGYANSDSGRMLSLVQDGWKVAAQLEWQRRLLPLLQAFDERMLVAIAAGDLDPNAEARYLARKLREADEEEREERAREDKATAAAVQGGSSSPGPGGGPDLPPQAMDAMAATVALIARDQLGFETLTVRNRDHLDFRECFVVAVRDALEDAYCEGWHAAA